MTSGSPTVQRRRLAAELKRLRGNRSGVEVSRAIGWSSSKISRAESGRESLPPAEIQKLIDFYGAADPLRTRLLEFASDAAQRGWWEEFPDALAPGFIEFVGLEAGASSACTWQSEVVPGLLQTQAYSRQLDAAYQRVDPATPPAAHERFLHVRWTRQERLTRDPVLRFSCVVDEAVLLRRIGDNAVMREQLAHLVEISARPNVDLRVLPLSQNNALGGVSSFTLLSFDPLDEVPSGALGDVVNTESLTAQQYIEEEAETHLYRLFFQAISDAALPAPESRDLIVTISEHEWSSTTLGYS